MNKTIQISFDIPYEIYNDSGKIIKLQNNLANCLNEYILSSSRKNCENKIISYDLGIIDLIENKINIKNNNVINIQFKTQLQNPLVNLDLENIKEIIWCIMPSTYDEEGTMYFSKDGAYRIQGYKLKVLDTPSNIVYNLT